MADFKRIKARVTHLCSSCSSKINIGDEYYAEDKFLASLNKRQKYCLKCFNK